jgi:hypothetical protein
MDVNRKVIVMYLDLRDLTDRELMNLYYTAQELRCGNMIKEVKYEMNRRNREA